MLANKDLKYDPDKEGRRIALCKTGNDGQFCFNGIASGNYMIVFSKKDFCRTIVVAKLAMHRQKSILKRLIVTLRVGG
jgi:hypothetical protein